MVAKVTYFYFIVAVNFLGSLIRTIECSDIHSFVEMFD